MVHFDLPLDQLKTYLPTVEEPGDFDAFWSARREDASLNPIDVAVESAGDLIRSAAVLDVRFSGHGGNRIAAWLYLPNDLADQTPVVVEYVGYGGGRGRPIDWLCWSSVGYPYLVVDSRGQGGGGDRGIHPIREIPENREVAALSREVSPIQGPLPLEALHRCRPSRRCH